MLKTIVALMLVAIFMMGTVAVMAECNSCAPCASPCTTCGTPDNVLQWLYDWFAGWHNPCCAPCEKPCSTCSK